MVAEQYVLGTRGFRCGPGVAHVDSGWAWGADDDIIGRLVKKTLFVGVFAYIIGNWNTLARIVFESFAGLGLIALGGSLSAGELLQPGRIAEVGLEAGRPILASIADLMGFVSFFENFIQIMILLFAWGVVVLGFFILAIQLFVTLIEFKLATLAGFKAGFRCAMHEGSFQPGILVTQP